jgi:hypothetical protein
VPVGEVDADQTSLLVDGLTEGKKYKFRVRAANAEGESEPLESDEPVEAKNPYTVPDPPQVSGCSLPATLNFLKCCVFLLLLC